MQKKLIALAVAGMFAAPAFAATSNVDVYGQINMSVESVSDGDDRWTRMVSNNDSFFGFKGSEDLGGGLSAVWQVEMNLNTDGNQSNAADAAAIWGTRNTFIGLSSKSFGTVLAGVHDTPYKMATGPLDIFVGTLGDYNAIMGSGGDAWTWAGWPSMANASNVFDLRTGNTIAYLSPDFSGFNFKAAYVMGGEGNDGGLDTSNAYSLSATYTNGPLFVTAAYEKHNDVVPGSCNAGALCLGFDSWGGWERDAWKIGASYKFGDLKVGAMYESMDDNWDYIGHNSWMINAAYTMGAMTFKGEYLQAGDLDGWNNSGAKMWALGMDYAMSKRTTIQLTYAKLSNDRNGNFALGQGPQVNPASAQTYTGDDPSGFGLGVRHSF